MAMLLILALGNPTVHHFSLDIEVANDINGNDGNIYGNDDDIDSNDVDIHGNEDNIDISDGNTDDHCKFQGCRISSVENNSMGES